LYVTTRDGVVHRETITFDGTWQYIKMLAFPANGGGPGAWSFDTNGGADGAANLPAVTFAAWGAQLNEGATLDDYPVTLPDITPTGFPWAFSLDGEAEPRESRRQSPGRGPTGWRGSLLPRRATACGGSALPAGNLSVCAPSRSSHC